MPDERVFTPTADDLWPAPLRPARNPNEKRQRELLVARRACLATTIEENEAGVRYWNRHHPDEDPIAVDVQLLAIARRIRQLEGEGR